MRFVALFLASSAALVAVGAPPVLAADPPSAPAVTVPTYENATCPIMGRPTSRVLFADTNYGRVYVCCPPCIAKIKADPERAYKTAYPVNVKAENKVCPITGEAVPADGPRVVLQGHEIGLCCAGCVAKAKSHAQVVLVKVLRPGTTDVGNGTCPITGKPVTANVFCLVGNDLIRLFAPANVDDVKKDPAKALKDAKDIAAKEAAAKKAAESNPK